MTPAVKYLLLANVVLFFLELPFSKDTLEAFHLWFGLTPNILVHKFAFWQPVTYMFLHGDFMHLLINMLVLWVIGGELERYWGTREFLRYYFVCGICAGLLQISVSQVMAIAGRVPLDALNVPVIGASGGIYGLLMAFGILFPNYIITLLVFFILPVNIKVKYLVTIAGLMVLYSSLHYVKEPAGYVAHFAHLGGMLVGFLYLKTIRPSLRWGVTSFSGRPPQKSGVNSLSKWFRQRTEKRRQMQVVRQRQQEVQLRERVDVVLDKINEVGYENLTDDEKQILKKASQFLSQKNLHSEGLS